MAVEARIGGGSEWFKGTIKRVHSDGSVDVEYDDGDTEKHLEPALVRVAEAWCWAVDLDNGGWDSLFIPKVMLCRGAGACRFVAEAWLEEKGLRGRDVPFRCRLDGERWGTLHGPAGLEQIPGGARVLRRVASAVWDSSGNVKWTSLTPQVR